MSNNAMIVLITASVLTYLAVKIYILAHARIKELEAKVEVLDAMTRTIKAAEERRAGAPFGNFKTDARKARSVPQKAKNAFRGFHERSGF